jgi:methylmalonyl-CoA/ethylmalonyl-CoA epimerase
MTTPSIAALGQVMQLAFVPGDFQEALHFWTTVVGAGPFFHARHVERLIRQTRYRGEISHLEFSVAIGYWGDMQIELIQQHNDVPSVYSSALKGGPEGLHHVCIQVDDMSCARAVCAEAGGQVVQEFFLNGGEAIYVDIGGGSGTLLEVIQTPTDQVAMFAMMHEAARNWDGTDPLRVLV